MPLGERSFEEIDMIILLIVVVHRWCQTKNVAYMATWHSNYLDYLKYYYLETVLGPAFKMYLQDFYNQIPAVYVPV